MDTLNNWSSILMESMREMTINISNALPNIFGAILILLFGWLFTKILIYLIRRFFKLIKLENRIDNLKQKEIFGNLKWNFKVSKIIIAVFKFIMFLVFLTAALEILNWNVISNEIGNLLAYLPKLLSAVVLFMVGLYIAGFIKKAVASFFTSLELVGAKAISHLVYYIIALIITITALNQAEIDTTIITNNLTLILGAFLLTIVIAFGLGARAVVQKIVFSFYSNKKYEIGETIILDSIEGKIVDIDSVSFTIKTEKGRMVIPIQEIMDSRVEIID